MKPLSDEDEAKNMANVHPLGKHSTLLWLGQARICAQASYEVDARKVLVYNKPV